MKLIKGEFKYNRKVMLIRELEKELVSLKIITDSFPNSDYENKLNQIEQELSKLYNEVNEMEAEINGK